MPAKKTVRTPRVITKAVKYLNALADSLEDTTSMRHSDLVEIAFDLRQMAAELNGTHASTGRKDEAVAMEKAVNRRRRARAAKAKKAKAAR